MNEKVGRHTAVRSRLTNALGLVDEEGNPIQDRRDVYESFLSGIALQLLLLITGIAAARILGEVGRGQQALIWIVSMVSAQVVLFGLPLALTYEMARGKIAAKRLMAHVAPFAWVQVATVLVVYTLIMILAFDGRVPRSAALIALPALPAMVWQIYNLALLQGGHRFRALHVFRLLPTALYAFGLVLVLLLVDGSVFSVVAAWSLSYTFAATCTQIYVWFFWNHHQAVETDLPSRVRMARFGASGFLGGSAPLEVLRADQLIVGAILTTVDLAYYTTALSFCNLPRFLSQALGLNAYAKISASDETTEKSMMLKKYVGLGTLVAVVVAVPLALLAEPLINLTFGPEFVDAAPITRILLLATVLLCIRRIISDCLRGMEAPGAGSIAEGVSLLALVIAIVILVPPLGLEGFAIGMVASYLAGLFTVIFFLAFRSDFRWRTEPDRSA